MVVFYNLVKFAMQENIEQSYASKFCVKLNKSATETLASLTEAYGDATPSRTMVFKWHKAFKEDRENVEVVWAVMAKDRWLSVWMITGETGLNKNVVHRILTEHLHMWKICA